LSNKSNGVVALCLPEKYILADDEWKHDSIPEIMDGHNVADFFDPDIAERLDALEAEEARLEAAGFYDEGEYQLDSDEEEIMEKAKKIRSKKELIRIESNLRKTRTRSQMPRSNNSNSKKRELGRELKEIGVEVRGRSRSVARNRDRSESAMEGVVMDRSRSQSKAARAKSHSRAREPTAMGLRDEKMKEVATKMKARSQTKRNLHGRTAESDRHIGVKLPKHLFAGKRGMGKTDRR
jgi:nucleolar GTP-binding protein